MELKVKMVKSKDTPGTHVYTAPKTDTEGKPTPITSAYLVKAALPQGTSAPAEITVTVSF
jgi:hypothetical protein